MGSSIGVYWPGINESQEMDAPGFQIDKGWADWLAGSIMRSWRLRRILKKRGGRALLTHITEGLEEDQVDWASPDELEAAAGKLIEAIRSGARGTDLLVKSYAEEAHFESFEGEGPEDWLITELEDIQANARFAREQGVDQLTFEMNW